MMLVCRAVTDSLQGGSRVVEVEEEVWNVRKVALGSGCVEGVRSDRKSAIDGLGEAVERAALGGYCRVGRGERGRGGEVERDGGIW